MKRIVILLSLLFALGLNARPMSTYMPKTNIVMVDTLATAAEIRNYSLNELHITIGTKMSDADVMFMSAQCDKHNIPIEYVIRLIRKESNFNPNAVNPNDGSSGYMQLHPPTYQSLKKIYLGQGNTLTGLSKGQENLTLGTFYIKRLWNKYSDWKKVFMAYNGGPGAVNNNSVGPAKYARSILGLI